MRKMWFESDAFKVNYIFMSLPFSRRDVAWTIEPVHLTWFYKIYGSNHRCLKWTIVLLCPCLSLMLIMRFYFTWPNSIHRTGHIEYYTKTYSNEPFILVLILLDSSQVLFRFAYLDWEPTTKKRNILIKVLKYLNRIAFK